jgi:hypothetical protein
MKRLFDFIEKLEGGGDLPIEQAVESVLKFHRGRGIAIVLSDFLTFGELSRPFNMLYSNGLEVFAIQILGPSELDPDLSGDLRFVDAETSQTLDVTSVGELVGIYHEHRLALEEQIAIQCRQRSGRFVSINSQDPLDWVLFDLFRRQGWVM